MNMHEQAKSKTEVNSLFESLFKNETEEARNEKKKHWRACTGGTE